MRIAIGSSSFGQSSDEAMELLKSKNLEISLNPYGRKMTEEETIKHLQGADGILAGLEPLTERVFEQTPSLRAIARIGIGMDNVDMEAAKRHGIKVSNTPDGPTDAVAEMTLTALLSIEHRLIESNNEIHSGIWKKHIGHSISELTVFFIGYGRIGRKTADMMRMMGAEIMIYDKYNESISTCTLEDGLKNADVVSLHASGKDLILSEREFAIMKEGMVLLNSARGALIDEDVLYNSLKNGKVSYYWGDAHWDEPYKGKLCGLSNAILTPHICTYTKKCRDSMEMQAVLNLLRDLNV